MLFLIPKNCQYVLVYRDNGPLDMVAFQNFTPTTYTVDEEPRRSTQPVVYFHGERADWTSEVGRAIKEELILTFNKLHRPTGGWENPRFNPSKIDEWWTAFLLPENDRDAAWAVYYTKEAMTKVPEYPGEKAENG